MTLTNRWFIEKKFLAGAWIDYSFNPESGYETKEQAEQYTLAPHHGYEYRVTERQVEFPVKRNVVFKSRVTEIEVDSVSYRKSEYRNGFTWEEQDHDYEWVTPYSLEIPELERVLTSQT